MKDKKIKILQVLIIIMVISIVIVAIIFMISNKNSKEISVERDNYQNETKKETGKIEKVKKKDYIPNASDEEKEQRGYELYGDDICKKSKYIVDKLKQGEWDSYHFGYDVEDNHSPGMLCDEHIFYCAICGEKVTGPGDMDFELCSKCAEITNRCGACGKLKLNLKEYKLAWEDFENKENIFEAMQEHERNPSSEISYFENVQEL